jgi:hypothetical protein
VLTIEGWLQVHRQVGESKDMETGMEMTVATVDKVLNDIRGYLFADGGDIRVQRVEEGKVYVEFEGACASCSSQVRHLVACMPYCGHLLLKLIAQLRRRLKEVTYVRARLIRIMERWRLLNRVRD